MKTEQGTMQYNIRIPTDTIEGLSAIAKRYRMKRSDLVRTALALLASEQIQIKLDIILNNSKDQKQAI